MKAILEAVWKHNQNKSNKKITKIACHGLGTATGRVLPKEAVRQMKLAYRNFKFPPQKIDWQLASIRHHEVKYGTKNHPYHKKS